MQPSSLAVSQIEACLSVRQHEGESRDLRFEHVGNGEGFVGSLWRGHCSEGKEKSFIAKTVAPFAGSGFPEALVSFFESVQPHKRECSLYQLLQCGGVSSRDKDEKCGEVAEENDDKKLPKCGCIPDCYGVTDGDETGKDIMLLIEDLSCHSSPLFSDGMTLLECEASFVRLAEFHASTKSIVSSLNREDTQVFVPWEFDPVSNDAVNHFADALKGKLSARGDKFLRSSASFLNDACCFLYDKPLPPTDDCIIHGDCWSSNIMINSTTGKASLIDFQFCRFSQPATDLAVLLCTSAASDIRQGENLSLLLQRYTKSYQHFSGSDEIMTVDKYNAALPEALHLILLSYETWTTNFDADKLFTRFSEVVEDIASLQHH